MYCIVTRLVDSRLSSRVEGLLSHNEVNLAVCQNKFCASLTWICKSRDTIFSYIIPKPAPWAECEIKT